MSKHTKGPWEFDLSTVWTVGKVDGAYRELCEMSEGSNNDGRLMAAAPELLEALKGSIHELEVNYMDQLTSASDFDGSGAMYKGVLKIIKAGKAAIAKAEGKTK